MSKLEGDVNGVCYPTNLLTTHPTPDLQSCWMLVLAGGLASYALWQVADGLFASCALQVRFRPAPACACGYHAASSGWALEAPGRHRSCHGGQRAVIRTCGRTAELGPCLFCWLKNFNLAYLDLPFILFFILPCQTAVYGCELYP